MKVGEDGFFHQLGVNFRHAVHLMAADDSEMRHADALVGRVVDDGHAAQQLGIAGIAMHHIAHEAVVDFVDDLQVPRQHALEQRHRPGLQRFRHQRVVGVGEGARGDIPGMRPFQAMLIDQHAHQFRDGDRRVGIVELNRHLVRQFVEGVVVFFVAIKNILQRSADEKILLLEPQLAPHFRRVIGIQHLG